MTRTIFLFALTLNVFLLLGSSCSKADKNTPGNQTDTIAIPPPAKKLLVSTVSGGAGGGFVNGTAAAAKFNYPTGLTIDSDGNLYVSDYGNHAIRLITNGGNVSTLAGNGNPGFTDGTGSSAQFFYPQQITIDQNKNIYAVGGHNNIFGKIRKITQAGVVTSIAGSGITGYADGDGPLAQFNNPFSIASDLKGNLFVADHDNSVIRKINASNYVSTFASTGLNGPVSLAIDIAGNLFVADAGDHQIKKISAAGVVSVYAGTGLPGFKDGSAASAQFNMPLGIASDSAGNLYIGDGQNQRIRKITPQGIVSTYAGSGTTGFSDGEALSASFNFPAQVAVDKQGNVYVADIYNSRIRVISLK